MNALQGVRSPLLVIAFVTLASLVNAENPQREYHYGVHLKPVGKFAGSHLATSGYDSPILYPFVEGRLVLRGRNRLFCYDLRQCAKSATRGHQQPIQERSS